MNRQEFVQAVLDLYVAVPDTPKHPSPHDRYVANRWFDNHISIPQVQQAILLAQIRRGYRRSADPPLNPIRSLHYFAPILQELQREPMDDRYYSYLQRKLDELHTMNGICPKLSKSG